MEFPTIPIKAKRSHAEIFTAMQRRPLAPGDGRRPGDALCRSDSWRASNGSHPRDPRLGKGDGPCGSLVYLDGHIDTTGPGTVWYRFLVPPGVRIDGTPEALFELKPN